MGRITKNILDAAGLKRVLVRMAHEVLEVNHQLEDLVIVGMRTRGEFIARRIAAIIAEETHVVIPVGVLDVSLYRDDFRLRLKQPRVQVTDIPCDIHEKNVILIDDVLFTGRTVRAALDALTDFGRPSTIKLGVLIDRGHRELPISADYIGKSTNTRLDEEIVVKMQEIDNKDLITREKIT